MTDEAPHGSLRGEVPARVLDLSLGGALLIVPTPLDVGSIQDFALKLGGETIWVQGEVRRAVPAPRGTGHEVGIEFVGVNPFDERLLRAWLEEQRRS